MLSIGCMRKRCVQIDFTFSFTLKNLTPTTHCHPEARVLCGLKDLCNLSAASVLPQSTWVLPVEIIGLWRSGP